MKHVCVVERRFEHNANPDGTGKVVEVSTTLPLVAASHTVRDMYNILPKSMNQFERELASLLVRAAEAGVIINVENKPDPKNIDPATGLPKLGMGQYMQVGTIRPSYEYVRLFMDEQERLKKVHEIRLEERENGEKSW